MYLNISSKRSRGASVTSRDKNLIILEYYDVWYIFLFIPNDYVNIITFIIWIYWKEIDKYI